MSTYETMYIIHPELPPEGITALNDKLKGVLTKNEANVINFEDWGKKKLAYVIKKQVKGHFCLINFDGPAKAINEFERIMKLSDDVIKFLSVQLSKDDVARLEKRVAAREKAAAEAAAAPAPAPAPEVAPEPAEEELEPEEAKEEAPVEEATDETEDEEDSET